MTIKLYNVRRAATYLLLVGCFLFALVLPVEAASGLMVIPPVIEKEAVPGVPIKGQLELNNPVEGSILVYPSIQEFKAKDESGEPDFDFSGDDANSKIAGWFKYDHAPIALEQYQYAYFNYEINVPINAEPGGHYATIFFSTEPPAANGGSPKVNLVSKIGSLVLIKVPGAINEQLKIKNFSASSTIFSQKAKLMTRLENLGNVHVKPKGNIVIKDMLGKEVSTLNFNSTAGNVLPGTVRKFETEWTGNRYAFGRYSAELSLVYGDKSNPLTNTIQFWIIPWWSIAGLIAVCLVFWTFNAKRRRAHIRWR